MLLCRGPGLLLSAVTEAAAKLTEPVKRLDVAAEILNQPGAHADAQVLDHVIALLTPLVNQLPARNSHRPRGVLLLANGLILRFEATSDMSALDQAEGLLRDAKGIFPRGSQGRSQYLATIAWARYRRAQHTDAGSALDAAEDAANRGLREFPRDATHHEGVARVFLLRYQRTADITALTRSVREYEIAVRLTREPGAERVARLSGLGNALDRSASATDSHQDLERAVTAHRQAVAALTEDDPSEATVKCNLGTALQHRYERTGSRADLIEAIALHREALKLTLTEKDIQYPVRTEGLANALMYLFESRDDPEAVAEAVRLRRATLKTLAPDDPMHKTCQANLAGSLFRRFERTGDTDSRAEAERLMREIVETTHGRDLVKAMRLNALGAIISRRGSGGLTSLADLEQARGYQSEAVAIAEAAGSEHLAMYRSNLANTLMDCYLHSRDEDHLAEAIKLHRRAVLGTPRGHTERGARLSNFALALITQAERERDASLLDEVDDACESILGDLLSDDAARARCLTIAGDAEKCRYELTGARDAADRALVHYEHAAGDSHSPVTFRIRAAHTGGVLAARIGSFERALAGFRDAVDLLERVVSPALSRHDQERILAGLDGLPRDAAAMAIATGQAEEAIVLLERSRGVLLGRALDARTEYDELRENQPALAEQLRAIQQELDGADNAPAIAAGERVPAHIPTPADHRAELTRRYETVLQQIRTYAGFNQFRRPIPFTQLQPAAADGPIVIVNVSEYRCDALIVTTGGTRVVKLPDISADAVIENAERFIDATDHGRATEVDDVIAWTWDEIAEPVLSALGLTGPPSDSEQAPRVWWCPTGMAAFLPLHVAGRHEPDATSEPRSVLDWTVPSYTPTLRTLLRERERRGVSAGSHHKGVLAVSVASSLAALAAQELAGVDQDVAVLRSRFPAVTVLADDEATCERVLQEMSGHQWTHLACHGVQNLASPFDGYLLMYDDKLTIHRITSQRLPRLEVAFVSACETFRGGNRLPDESITLASALQLAGYRHVIATQWQLFGGRNAEIVATFYDEIFRRDEESGMPVERAAAALRAAMLHARTTPDYARPFYWASYIHTGP